MAGGRGKSLQTSERWECTAAALTSFLFLSGEAAVLLLFFWDESRHIPSCSQAFLIAVFPGQTGLCDCGGGVAWSSEVKPLRPSFQTDGRSSS